MHSHGEFAPSGLIPRIHSGIEWRLRNARKRLWTLIGGREIQWLRVEMNRTTMRFLESIHSENSEALEISGVIWRHAKWRKYETIDYPQYDICSALFQSEAYDVVIAEQVLEHVLFPWRAVRNIYAMVKPGGWAIVTTPFLVRVHEHPIDCSRWTELGLKYLLAEGGFDLDSIHTGSWGNRECVRANLRKWRLWLPWWHSLHNETGHPVVVWAYAQKEIK